MGSRSSWRPVSCGERSFDGVEIGDQRYSQPVVAAHGVVAAEHDASLAGLAAARGRYIVMTDADGTYPIESLGVFVERLRDGADMVIGNRFKLVEAMVTNFHMPRSTVLALVMALAGRELILRGYAEAIRHRYRFLSYGDAMLVL